MVRAVDCIRYHLLRGGPKWRIAICPFYFLMAYAVYAVAVVADTVAIVCVLPTEDTHFYLLLLFCIHSYFLWLVQLCCHLSPL
jgi:hypothetical protein